MELKLKLVVGVSLALASSGADLAVWLQLSNNSLESLYFLPLLASAGLSTCKSLFLFELFKLDLHFPGVPDFLHTIFHNRLQFDNNFFLFSDSLFVDIDPFMFFVHSVYFLVEDLNVVFLCCYYWIQLHCVADLRLHCLYCSVQVSVFDPFHLVELGYLHYLLFEVPHVHVLHFPLNQIYQLVFLPQSLLPQNAILILKKFDSSPQIAYFGCSLSQRFRFVIEFSKNSGDNIVVLSNMFQHRLVAVEIQLLHQLLACCFFASGYWSFGWN